MLALNRNLKRASRILDMTRTAVNITGDAVCTTIVAHQNKALDRDAFNNS